MFLHAAVECNGELAEEQNAALQADQEVPHPDLLPDPSAGDFDFNEFFNLEKTMPALASVSTGGTALVIKVMMSHEGCFCSHLTRSGFLSCSIFTSRFFKPESVV